MTAVLLSLVEQFTAIPTFHLVIEGLLVLAVIKLVFFSKKYSLAKNERLKPSEEEELIREFTPTPLVAAVQPRPDPPIIDGPITTHVLVDGKDKLNFASFNFLNFIGRKDFETTAKETIRKYGVGSCGPRGFYGTIDVHLDLEKDLAEFLAVEEVILYSFGFSTIASVIPAYSKKGDIIFYDLRGFKHNDMDHLESLLQQQAKEDQKDSARAKATRRFLVVEGIYANSGDIAPLKKLVELKYKYKVRLIVEETFSFGVLGKTGRGLTEHTGVSVEDVDLIVGSLETSLGSIGGFAGGRSYVIDHQRLSGQGYCFSASLPPFLATSASAGLRALVSDAEVLRRLQTNVAEFRSLLSNDSRFSLSGNALSPIFHLRLTKRLASTDEDETALQAVVDAAMGSGVALTVAKYVRTQEMHNPSPSIRLSVSAGHTKEELKKAAEVLKQAIATVC